MCAFLLLGHSVPMVFPWQSQDVRKERFGMGPVTMTPRMMAQTTTGLVLMIWQDMFIKMTWNKSSAWRPGLKPQSTTSHGPKDNTASTRKEFALKVGWLLLFGSLVDPISINDIVVGLSYRFKPTHTILYSVMRYVHAVIVHSTWYPSRELNRSVLSPYKLICIVVLNMGTNKRLLQLSCLQLLEQQNGNRQIPGEKRNWANDYKWGTEKKLRKISHSFHFPSVMD